jgi:hypothetical protein
MKLTDELFTDYLESIKPKYYDEVFNKMLSTDYDKKIAEESAIEFYSKKNEGIKPIVRWVENPIKLSDEYPGEKIKLFSTYLNINWIYFYFTFIDNIKENNIPIKSEYYDFERKKEVYNETKLVFDMLVNSFGVCEISGKDKKTKKHLDYKEIVLIEKPKGVSIVDNKLHSIKGPAFYYDIDLMFFYLEGVKISQDLWIQTIKTALKNPNSVVYNELKSNDKLNLKKFISSLEKKCGKQKDLTPKEILSINNLEERSKVIKYVGIDMIMELAQIISEQPITTHKGDIINYQLFELQLGLEVDNIPSRFVKVICWSTNKEYILQVDPRNKQCETPLGAIAWTCVKPDGNHCTEEEYLQLQFQS